MLSVLSKKNLNNLYLSLLYLNELLICVHLSNKSSTNKANSEAFFIILIWIPKYLNLKLENNFNLPDSSFENKN